MYLKQGAPLAGVSKTLVNRGRRFSNPFQLSARCTIWGLNKYIKHAGINRTSIGTGIRIIVFVIIQSLRAFRQARQERSSQ